MLLVNFISVMGSTNLMVTVHDGNNNLVIDIDEADFFDEWCEVLGVVLPDTKLETKVGTVIVDTYKVDRCIQTKEFSNLNELPEKVKPCLNTVLRKEGSQVTIDIVSYVHIGEHITTIYKPVKKSGVYITKRELTDEEKYNLPQILLNF